MIKKRYYYSNKMRKFLQLTVLILLTASFAYAQVVRPRIKKTTDTTANCTQNGDVGWDIYNSDSLSSFATLASGTEPITFTDSQVCKRYITQRLSKILEEYVADNVVLEEDGTLPVPTPPFAVVYRINDPTVGTVLNQLVTGTNASPPLAKRTDAGMTNAAGICVKNCGISGISHVAVLGNVLCDFDGPTTSRNFVGVSPTENGKCHDLGFGTGFPTKDKVVGIVHSTNAGAGAYEVALFPIGVRGHVESAAVPTGKFIKDDGTFADPPAGGSPPTGTGFRHVTAGIEDAASSLPTKSDVGLGSVDNTSDTAKPISTATQTALDAKAAASHAHAQADVTNLVTDLAAKAASVHAHAQADITGLTTDLAAKQPLDSDLTTIAALACANGEIPKRAGGVWTCGTDSTGGGGGGPTFTRVTADVSSTDSTNFADVTGLTFSVAASTNYSFACEMFYTTSASTNALQLSVNGPASPTALRYAVRTSTTATAMHTASQSAYDTVTNPATGGGATALLVHVAGTLENGSNSGTLAIRLRSETGGAVTVLRGSLCYFATY